MDLEGVMNRANESDVLRGSFYVHFDKKSWRVYTEKIVFWGNDRREVVFVDKDGKRWFCPFSKIIIEQLNYKEKEKRKKREREGFIDK